MVARLCVEILISMLALVEEVVHGVNDQVVIVEKGETNAASH